MLQQSFTCHKSWFMLYNFTVNKLIFARTEMFSILFLFFYQHICKVFKTNSKTLMKDCIIVIPYTRVSGFCTFLEHGC